MLLARAVRRVARIEVFSRRCEAEDDRSGTVTLAAQYPKWRFRHGLRLVAHVRTGAGAFRAWSQPRPSPGAALAVTSAELVRRSCS